MKALIDVKDLRKTFRVPKKTEGRGVWAKTKNILVRHWEPIEVLKGISFQVQKGEFVGYIGANGAGKSTTLKTLTGILCPDSGSVRCVGMDPYAQRYHYTYHIGVVFGQKSILEYEVPVSASFELYRRIYEMSDQRFKERMGFFNELLSINNLLHIPVRKLSFGQRMRCEVVASLLHQPDIVFLDEPTIGLDASAKKEIREFLRQVNEVEQTTVLLTTHDMKDIESLCERVMLIDQGQLIYDGSVDQLKRSTLREKTLHFHPKHIRSPQVYEALQAKVNVQDGQDGERWTLRTDEVELSAFVQSLLECCEVLDLSMSEPELEDVVHHIYGAQGLAEAGHEGK